MNEGEEVGGPTGRERVGLEKEGQLRPLPSFRRSSPFPSRSLLSWVVVMVFMTLGSGEGGPIIPASVLVGLD